MGNYRESMLRRVVLWGSTVGVLVASAMPMGALADTINPPLPDTPEVTAPLKRAISISQPKEFSVADRKKVVALAKKAGALAYPGRAVTLGLVRVHRIDATTRIETLVQSITRGYQVPMSTTVQDIEVVRNLMSLQAAEALQANNIVMGRSSAIIRGARIGDIVTLLDIRNKPHEFVIGNIAEDNLVGEADLLLSPQQADVLGATMITRFTIIGFTNATALEIAIRAAGFRDGNAFHVRKTWDAPDPDATRGLAAAKRMVGEFAYKVSESGKVLLEGGWPQKYISPRTVFDDIAVKAACNVNVRVAMQGALSEVMRQGLGKYVDANNTNAYGGCFYPRYNRLAGKLGYLSRHSWGMALDMNTSTNAQGGVPHMDCRIVRIFRHWGFAWGGNFTPSDGMHFEYVGERRDNLAFPSRYCPNIVGAQR